jgi:hypothetical protein
MARPKPELVLTADERQKLATWARRPKSSQRLALRARIILACADEPKPFHWVADADAILDRIKKVRERTSDSGH